MTEPIFYWIPSDIKNPLDISCSLSFADKMKTAYGNFPFELSDKHIEGLKLAQSVSFEEIAMADIIKGIRDFNYIDLYKSEDEPAKFYWYPTDKKKYITPEASSKKFKDVIKEVAISNSFPVTVDEITFSRLKLCSVIGYEVDIMNTLKNAIEEHNSVDVFCI